jgi:hypothetical protein
MLELPQARETRDPQFPEKTWMMAPDVLRLLPTPLNVTVALVAVGVKVYHTSSSAVPEQTVGTPLSDANHTVPALPVPIARASALAQLSLAGGCAACVTQISKLAVPAPEGSVPTLEILT